MTDGALKGFSSVRVTFAKAGHELVIRLRVAAVAVARLRQCQRKSGSQRFHYAAPDFILKFEYVLHFEVVFFGKTNLVDSRIEDLNRNTPQRADLLNISLQGVTDADVATDLRGIDAGGIVQNGGCRKYPNVLQAAQHRN